jgi:alpha-glucosidase
LHVYAGADGSYVYYEDDGETYNCNNGSYFKREFTYNETSKLISVGKVEGSFDSHFTTIKVFVHGLEAGISKASGLTITIEEVSFIDALSNFDPYNKPPREKPVCKHIATFVIENKREAFEISLK